jgi:GT2 family glycosyltransferase
LSFAATKPPAATKRRRKFTVGGFGEEWPGWPNAAPERLVYHDIVAVGVTPRVSVVIPAYNSERYLGGTIESVLSQTFQDWELVIFDDGSVDGTIEVAREHAARERRIRLFSGPNGGVASARNRGLEATDAGSQFVAFLDNDDQWDARALEMMVGMLDRRPEYGAVHCLARCMDGDGKALDGDDLEDYMRARYAFETGSLVAVAPSAPTTFAALAYQNWTVTPGTLLIRRSVAALVGPFDHQAVPADDWDMSVRVSRLTDIGYIDQPLLWWRRHGGAQSYSRRWGRAYVYVRRKMLLDAANTPDHTRMAREGFRHVIGATLADACRNARRTNARRTATQSGKGLYQLASWLWTEVSRAVRSLAGGRVMKRSARRPR